MKRYLLKLTKVELKLKILIVDDSMHYADSLSDFLVESCYQITVKSQDPKEAIKIVRNSMYDTPPIQAAFIDYIMPKMNGLELAIELKKVSPKMPIIIITEHDSFRTKRELSSFPEITASIYKGRIKEDIPRILCMLLAERQENLLSV